MTTAEPRNGTSARVYQVVSSILLAVCLAMTGQMHMSRFTFRDSIQLRADLETKLAAYPPAYLIKQVDQVVSNQMLMVQRLAGIEARLTASESSQ
jgi:hypothetical protein